MGLFVSHARIKSGLASLAIHGLVGAVILLATLRPQPDIAFEGSSLATFDVSQSTRADIPVRQDRSPPAERPDAAIEPVAPVAAPAAMVSRTDALPRRLAAPMSAPGAVAATPTIAIRAPLLVPPPSASGIAAVAGGDAMVRPPSPKRGGGADGAAADSYAARVAEWLERHKAFPGALARDRQDATVVVRFIVDGRGRAKEVQLVSTSGIEWLDLLALDQVRDASPFPRPPAGLDAAARSFEVPMRYRARG